jgi:hypothetical protein
MNQTLIPSYHTNRGIIKEGKRRTNTASKKTISTKNLITKRQPKTMTLK